MIDDAKLDEIERALRKPEVSHHQISDDGESYQTRARVHPVEPLRLTAADAIADLRGNVSQLEAILKRATVREVTRLRALIDAHDAMDVLMIDVPAGNEQPKESGA